MSTKPKLVVIVPHRIIDTSISNVLQSTQSEQSAPRIVPIDLVGGAEFLSEVAEEITHESDHIGVSIVSNNDISHKWLVQLLEPYADLSIVNSYLGRSLIPNAPDIPDIPAMQMLADADTHTPNLLAYSDHVVLLDDSLNLGESLAWLRHWRTLPQPPYVVVLAMINDIGAIVAYIEAGISGYTLEGVSAVEIIETIRGVCQGATKCSPEVTSRLFAHLARYTTGANTSANVGAFAGDVVLLTQLPTSTPTSIIPTPLILSSPIPIRAPVYITPIPDTLHLTPRELEVLVYIAKDFSNKEIASILVIQVPTVKHHVHNILEKLDLRHRWDVARFAVEQGWLELAK